MLYCIKGKYQTEEEEKEEKEEKEEEPIFGRHGVAHWQTSYWSATCSPDNAIAVHEDINLSNKMPEKRTQEVFSLIHPVWKTSLSPTADLFVQILKCRFSAFL